MVRGATRSRSLLPIAAGCVALNPADVLEPVGQLTQQRRAGIPDHPVPPVVNSNLPGELTACTRKVASSTRM
jgi:hypothetical protein